MTVRKTKPAPTIADQLAEVSHRAIALASENTELRLDNERSANRYSDVFTERNRLKEDMQKVSRELETMKERATAAEHRVSFLEGFLTAIDDAGNPPASLEERRPRRGWQSAVDMMGVNYSNGRGY